MQTIEDFLKKYYKHNRYIGRGGEYANSLLQSYKKEMIEYGYCLINHHDSSTGKVVCLKKDRCKD